MSFPDNGLLQDRFLQTMLMRNCSQRTIDTWRYILNRFAAWCLDVGVASMADVCPNILAAYRRSLYAYRNPRTGKALKFDTQGHYLLPVCRWFTWMVDQGYRSTNPSKDLELPKSEHRLPTTTMSSDQVEALLKLPDTTTPLGVRDRAILETFYSSGIRCSELVGLDIYDVKHERGLLAIRRGKNRKDRMVPIGCRALSWIKHWSDNLRGDLAKYPAEQSLFLSKNGRRLHPNGMSSLVRCYLVKAGVSQRGACHLLRHTAATLMMENGADLRSLQEFLGHAKVSTTQIYTHVSIKRLQEVHGRTHPANFQAGFPAGQK